MTTAFPTTSSHSVELAYPDYDIDQLVKAVDGAIKDKDKYAAHQTSSDPSHFHLHTCTIETALFPPKPTIPYHNRPDQPNPAYEYFTSVREKVAATVGPFSPLTITSPSSNSIRPGYQFQRSYGSGRTSFYGTKVYLPGAHNKTHLAMLSPLPNTARYEWSPTSKAWDLEHWLQTIFALDPKIDANRKSVYRDDKKRFHLGTGLQICWVPDGDGPDAGIELKLLITIDVFVDMNAIYTSLPDVGNDLVGFVLHSLLHSPTSVQATSESEARAAGLRHFYSTLRPAPDLPFNYSARQLQPKEMVSRLLPFQTRTLRLLLQREQAENLSQDFKPVRSDPVGFWKGYDLGENFGRVGYRRLTGDLTKVGLHRPIKVDRKGKGRAYDQTPESVPDDLDEKDRENLPVLLDLSGVRGTMLCEEMGLGKTVEAIALILLHRHPLSHSRSSTATTIAQNGETSKIGSRQNGRVDKEAVPVIDLIKGPPGLEDEAVHKWATDEGIAFESRQAWDDNAKLNVTEVATTLIVTPPSLLKQWVSEMQRHAPSLRICVYEGWKSLQRGVEKQRAARLKAQGVKAQAEKKRKNAQFRNQTRKKYAKSKGGDRIKQESDNEDDDDVIATQASVVEEEGTLQVTQRQFVEYVRAHDVVITTYGDLSQDLKVATPAPPRSRRSTAKYQPNERPRSPLVMVEWWRVIMDEVQLHGDQTDAANMVSLIPRKNSLAVSGTPARTDVKDLLGSLRFLRVPVLPNDNGYDHRLWHRLQQPSWRPAFEGLFRSIAVRTTKKEVAGEFNLPHQSRYVVPIELSQIELHYYNDTLQRTRERLHLPADPKEARPPDWVLDRTLFRTCLQALRQICTHIQVGQMQAGVGRGDQRLHLGRSLMTMTEALNKMIHDHTAEYLVETRQQMRAMIRKAQLTMLDNNNDLRYLTAANMGPVREHLKQLLGGKDDTSESGREASPEKHQSQQDKERHAVLTATRQTIREMSIVLHQAWFFEGDVRHILKEVDAEVECYAQADTVRKEILRIPLQSANMSVELLENSMARTSAVHEVLELQTKDIRFRGGVLSNDVAEQANNLLKILNDNAVLVFEWRAKILALLSSPIDVSQADLPPAEEGQDVQDPEAEYYAEALKAQGEVEAYLIAYASAIADRKEFMLESRSLLATHDARVTKQRITKAALNAIAEDEVPSDVTDEVSEQAAVLMKERQAFREARSETGCDRPLKALLMDLNVVVHGPNRPEEITIAQRLAKFIKDYIHKQSEYVEKLNKELDLFRATFNRRVRYFAALQEISDSVTAPDFKDLAAEIQAASQEIDEIEAKLSKMVIKGRYLKYLGEKQDMELDIREDCIICFGSSDDDQAVLLQCGHYFCLSCYKEFRKSAGGRKCPSCRIDIDTKEITRIKINSSSHTRQIEDNEQGDLPISQAEGEELPEESGEEQERATRAADLHRLKMMDVDTRREIMMMDILGEYGSKINFLIKHLLYYRSKECETRHVIFSNWSDSLNIVMQALRSNGIRFMSFDQGKKQKDVVDQFIKDTSVPVFLLHAERESSGLTLTTCRVVHLLEPVLRHSFELQAIGRVDRLGQDKETTVFCYATMETVESRILSQGVRNGTSIYLDADNADHVVADMPNVASAAHKGGDVGGDSNEEDLLGLIL